MPDLEPKRFDALMRGCARVQDFSIALMAGVDDDDWNAAIRRRFGTVHCVPPPDYPDPIDQLELPYCGLIVLHLDDPADAIFEAVQTIQRCKPVVLVGNDAGPILSRLGMRELYRAGTDRIYGWLSR